MGHDLIGDAPHIMHISEYLDDTNFIDMKQLAGYETNPTTGGCSSICPQKNVILASREVNQFKL